MDILNMTDEDIISELSAGNPHAGNHLIQVVNVIGTDEFRKLAIDLDDMRISGDELQAALTGYCGGMVEMFVQMVTGRNDAMVAYLHQKFPGSMARQHGEQFKIKPLDAAVKNIIAEAEQAGNLARMDEGAEYIHNFFLGMLATMQKERKFVSNMRVNLAGMTGEAAWGVFAIHFVELVNAEGKPLAPADQPQNEKEAFPPPKDGSGWKDAAVESPEDTALPEKRGPLIEDGPVTDNGEPLR